MLGEHEVVAGIKYGLVGVYTFPKVLAPAWEETLSVQQKGSTDEPTVLARDPSLECAASSESLGVKVVGLSKVKTADPHVDEGPKEGTINCPEAREKRVGAANDQMMRAVTPGSEASGAAFALPSASGAAFALPSASGSQASGAAFAVRIRFTGIRCSLCLAVHTRFTGIRCSLCLAVHTRFTSIRCSLCFAVHTGSRASGRLCLAVHTGSQSGAAFALPSTPGSEASGAAFALPSISGSEASGAAFVSPLMPGSEASGAAFAMLSTSGSEASDTAFALPFTSCSSVSNAISSQSSCPGFQIAEVLAVARPAMSIHHVSVSSPHASVDPSGDDCDDDDHLSQLFPDEDLSDPLEGDVVLEETAPAASPLEPLTAQEEEQAEKQTLDWWKDKPLKHVPMIEVPFFVPLPDKNGKTVLQALCANSKPWGCLSFVCTLTEVASLSTVRSPHGLCTTGLSKLPRQGTIGKQMVVPRSGFVCSNAPRARCLWLTGGGGRVEPVGGASAAFAPVACFSCFAPWKLGKQATLDGPCYSCHRPPWRSFGQDRRWFFCEYRSLG